MARPAYRSKTFDFTSTGHTSFTASEPASAAENDILVMWIVVASGATSIVGPTGWTLLDTQDGSAAKTRMWWIRRGASAPNLDVSWTTSVSYSERSVTAWTDCATTGNPYDDVQGYYNASQQNPDTPSATSSGTERLAVSFGSNWTGATAWTPPSGYTGHEVGTTDLCVASKSVESGAEDPGAWSGATSTDNVMGVTLILRGISGGGGGGVSMAWMTA